MFETTNEKTNRAGAVKSAKIRPQGTFIFAFYMNVFISSFPRIFLTCGQEDPHEQRRDAAKARRTAREEQQRQQQQQKQEDAVDTRLDGELQQCCLPSEKSVVKISSITSMDRHRINHIILDSIARPAELTVRGRGSNYH